MNKVWSSNFVTLKTWQNLPNTLAKIVEFTVEKHTNYPLKIKKYDRKTNKIHPQKKFTKF
jgi:hypothetical protein